MTPRFIWLLPLLMLAAIAGAWFGMDQHQGGKAGQSFNEDPSAATQASTTRAPRIASAKTSVSNALDHELSAIERSISSEQLALEKVRKEIASLKGRLPEQASDEIVSSFGKISEMGRDAGRAGHEILRLAEEHSAGDKQNEGETDETSLVRFMSLIGRLPEIRAFEDKPDEIAEFQSHALAESLGLDEAAINSIKPSIAAAFADMAAKELTMSSHPPDDDKNWKTQRTAALHALMFQLRSHLPEQGQSMLEKQALQFFLNLGAMPDAETQSNRVSWGLNWPGVPW